MIKKLKKGDLPSGWIVIIILLLVGFAILAYFLYNFLQSGQVNSQTCHESVVFRGTAVAVAGEGAQNYVPLKCKTAKYCITNSLIGKGNCPEFKGEESDVTKFRATSVTDIDQFMSRQILDCYNMMGQGKLSLFSQYLSKLYGVGTVYPTCIICSRIAFDKDSLENAGIHLKDINLNSYMLHHKVPGQDISYTDFLAGDNAQISVKNNVQIFGGTESQNLDVLQNPSESDISKEEVAANPNIYNEQMAVMFMQISAPGYWDAINNDFKTVLGVSAGSYSVAPTLSKAALWGAKKLVSIIGWKITLAMVAIGGAYQMGSVAHNRAITAGYCGDVSAGGEARNGCSVVRTVNYKADDITNYCAVVESVP